MNRFETSEDFRREAGLWIICDPPCHNASSTQHVYVSYGDRERRALFRLRFSHLGPSQLFDEVDVLLQVNATKQDSLVHHFLHDSVLQTMVDQP